MFDSRLVCVPLLLLMAAEPVAQEDPLHPAAPFIRESTFNQDPAAGKLKGRTLRIKRPLLIVADLGRSLDFYVDIVGLEVYEVADTYNRDPESLGYQMFNIPVGTPKRMATLNTSDEVRGMTLQEVSGIDVPVEQNPRTHTVLFETDDAIGIRDRAAEAGFQIVEPVLGDIPATDKAPGLRFVEFGVIDPDGHVVAFFQYFNDDASWQKGARDIREVARLANIVLIYSTVDGHTREICERLREVIERDSHQVTITELTDQSRIDIESYDRVVIGASIRYGKHRPDVAAFIEQNQAALESRKRRILFSECRGAKAGKANA